ncbi:MAG: putative membrane protein [Halonotius sp. J07HN4]|nr:MAG: putative membrane protein [Halonotius sp. J07HN4]
MESFIGIVGTAFLLQLTALPGEKGQLVIAGLATRYNPYMVVAGAATAFGGWTAIEILLGNALKGALPEVYLDIITAALFFIFAAWLLYTTVDGVDTPEIASEGSRLAAIQSRLPARLHGFLPSFWLMVFGEFGDKTQLVTIGLAVQYGATPAIWLGEMLAIVPVSLATALFFSKTAHRLDQAWFHRVAAGIFILFGLDIVASYTIGRSFLPI